MVHTETSDTHVISKGEEPVTIVIADTGHSVHLENPDLIVRKVLERIQQTSQRNQLQS
ncbi:hypothetical protein [Halobacillus faecis]